MSNRQTTPAQRKLSDMFATSSRFSKISMAVATAEAGHEVYNKTKEKLNGYFAWQVSVSEDDPVFRAVHTWMLVNVPESQHRALKAQSTGSDVNASLAEDGGSNRTEKLEFYIDDETSHHVIIDGHRVRVWVANPSKNETNSSSEKRLRLEPISIRFSARTQAGQRAVIKLLRRLHADRTARKPSLRMVTNWGSWQWRMDVPQRSLSSVILPTEQKERIVADLQRFLLDESKYAELGAPWHRGYMFHGPPGTGKTSLVKALATHFELDLWYAPLSDLKDESGLMNLISEVSPRSILLLEDIDTVRIARDREQNSPGITMSSLLNALDGVATPHGLVVFMTTNHYESLDEALTRAGRMDRIEEINMPGPEEVAAMFKHFYGQDPGRLLPGISHAAIAEVFKRHMSDYEAAVAEIKSLS
jgi:hypothetical protein